MLRTLAFAAAFAFLLLIGLYVREFEVFSRTLQVRALVIGSMLTGAALIGVLVLAFRRRFQPWHRHVTELLFIGVFGMLFSPLFGSLLNRLGSTAQQQSFEFVGETPYMTAGYGVLKGEKIQPTGYHLLVRQGSQLYRLRYRSQPYFPISRPGDTVSLPLRHGLFGVQVLDLK
ncbi:MAG TPA: hypothetical protein PK971_09965 [Saprospiraceae bacterium]|nr:hypothetical protein [Saprospiraceae bacterium]HND88646.1 hypothetical protein [Saprospiraceae bacterium]